MSEVIFSHVITVAKLTDILSCSCSYTKLNYSIAYIVHKFKMSAQKATNPKQGKKRKQNFNSEECNLLVNIVEQNLDTLWGQFSSTITNAKKQKLWETIYFPD